MSAPQPPPDTAGALPANGAGAGSGAGALPAVDAQADRGVQTTSAASPAIDAHADGDRQASPGASPQLDAGAAALTGAQPQRTNGARIWRCECGAAYRIVGSGRHRIYWPLDAPPGEPIIDGRCASCGRALPGKQPHDNRG